MSGEDLRQPGEAPDAMAACEVSIIIKALNEEKNIARAVESSLRATQGMKAEVILADSLSADRTVDIASAYPIRIVQLLHREDRSCGVGAQLGYQFARGEFVYILDGDMELCPGFLERALEMLRRDPQLAGVAGQVEEMHTDNLEFRNRQSRKRKSMGDGEVDKLNMGGLYRRSAIKQVGYFTNRNLHSNEELELGLRLRAKGWRLLRIETPGIRHYGHTDNSMRLLLRRWRSGYVRGAGMLLRSAWGTDYLPGVLRHCVNPLMTIGWWTSMLVGLLLPLGWPVKLVMLVVLLTLPFLFMSVKKRSLMLGVFSVLTWNIFAAGLLAGLFNPMKPTDALIDAREFKQTKEAG